MNPGHVWHLAKRFGTSLSVKPLSGPDEAWARRHLVAGERLIWDRMSNPDRRHAVGVARAVVAELGPHTGSEVVAAALLHDSGKVISGFATITRVGATLFWGVAPNSLAYRWVERPGFAGRLAQYRLHPELGARLLADAGADPLTVAWAAEHHLPVSSWSVPAEIGAVLKDCDDD